jgi:hypothetical protein
MCILSLLFKYSKALYQRFYKNTISLGNFYFLEIFKKEPGKFMSMDLPETMFKKVSDLAKEQAGEDSGTVSQTIDNLSDLKSSGLFDAD